MDTFHNAIGRSTVGGGILQRICNAAVIYFTRVTVAQDSNSKQLSLLSLAVTQAVSGGLHLLPGVSLLRAQSGLTM